MSFSLNLGGERKPFGGRCCGPFGICGLEMLVGYPFGDVQQEMGSLSKDQGEGLGWRRIWTYSGEKWGWKGKGVQAFGTTKSLSIIPMA